MHVPDGLLNTPTAIGAGIVTASIVGVSIRGARTEMGDRSAPLAGLLAAAIFALQLISFPIVGGTGAHLLGGTLAAILIGPCAGLLCLTVVEIVQSLMFGDGGITGLGASILCMDIAPIIVGFGIYQTLQRLLPKTNKSVSVTAGISAFFSVIAGATVFVVLYEIGGATSIPLRTVATGVLGAHLIIATIEAILTTVAIRAVLFHRPDLIRNRSANSQNFVEVR